MKIQLPKNVQQIGESPSDQRVYLEDYVITFLEQLTKYNEQAETPVLLYGRREQENDQTCYFVYGAVIKEESTEPEKLQSVFPAYEMIGEAYVCREGEDPQRRARRYEGSAVQTSLLLFIGDNQETLAVILSGQSKRQLNGYYIFYDKNEVMQNILLEWYRNAGDQKTETGKDYAVKEFRERYDGRQEEFHRRKLMTVLYTASLLLIMLCCITGISMMNQYDKMLRMEATIEHLAMAMEERELPEIQPVLSSAVEPETAAQWETVAQPEMPMQTVTEVAPETQTQAETEVTPETQTQAETEVTPETQTQTEAKEQIYIVKEGDTLAAISKSYYGTIRKVTLICEKNQITEPDNIMVGQKILLP